MTDPEPKRLRSGHWLLIGIVALLVVGIFTVTRRDRDPDDKADGVTTAPTASAPAGPVCAPKVAETGQSIRQGLVNFGIVVTSDCPQAAVASQLDVVAIGTDGKELTGDQAKARIFLSAVLPGQRLGAGGKLLVDINASIKNIRVSVSNTQNVPADAFSSWPTVHVADIKHSGPDSSGHTQVTGTVVTDPSTAKPCDPTYYLLLRNGAGTLIYGAAATGSEPSFDERLPSGIDWAKAEISVAMGTPPLGTVNTQQLTCQ
ncbi:hypothetical protein [Actinoplanes sp. NPDC020271]|uniref:hypothetical protein n=1 Tax=Actinoplanes sp. NPDC020271 TaxID=3363896 RepID=UPI0037A0AE76